MKRAFDLVLSALALVVLTPLLLVLGLAIRLDTPGPVFFRQTRVGRHGRHFRIHKLRTMHLGSEVHGQLTLGADVRVTRVGGWLRRTKLDELPQLIDVLKGDMSLVGPRPEVPRYVALYPPDLKARVLAVRPGITDPASLDMADESALLADAAQPERVYVQVILPAKLRAAADYAERANLATDLAVLWRTLVLLLRRISP